MDSVTTAVAWALDMALTHTVERDTLACDLTPAELQVVAQAAIAAYQAQMVPMGWRYDRKPEAWPPAPSVVQAEQWDKADEARPYWTETPLYALPTPPKETDQ
jgi:hypothetical protein